MSLKICGLPYRTESYGGGQRFHCPNCNVRKNDYGIPMISWTNGYPAIKLCNNIIRVSNALTRTDRNSKLIKTDEATKDSEGNYIIFGSDYTDNKGNTYDIVGLDLRSTKGWVVAWNLQDNCYTCVQAHNLTPAQKD